MKYCIVYGGPRKKNTYHAVQLVKERLTAHGPAEFTEFFLPKDFPKFCTGCFTCFVTTEERCPHWEYAAPIERAILEADGLIFATPVYVMEMAAPMKNMLDHFGYLFMAHRPRKEMFGKAALVVSTTAGAGTNCAMSGIARSLSYWGISRIFRCGVTMWAGDFEEMQPKRRSSAEHSLRKAADRLYESLRRGGAPSLQTKLKFLIMKQAVFRFADNPADKNYWRAQGWEQRGRPWKQRKGDGKT